METIRRALQIDPAPVCEEAKELIRTTTEHIGRGGAVVGLSGGLDSAVAASLAVRSLGRERVRLLNMPERDSDPVHREHAGKLAKHLGIRLATKSITPILRAAGTYKLLPLSLVPGRRWRARLVEYSKSRIPDVSDETMLANRFQPEAETLVAKGVAYSMAKHRSRVLILYQYAEVHNLLVIGAANRTEWLTGTFCKWGVDQCADIMPLVHLYRCQLEQLAEYLDVPEFIRCKPADPDVIPGANDKGRLLGGFDTADQILCGIELGIDEKELAEAYGEGNVARILNLSRLSGHLRESPYHNGGQRPS